MVRVRRSKRTRSDRPFPTWTTAPATTTRCTRRVTYRQGPLLDVAAVGLVACCGCPRQQDDVRDGQKKATSADRTRFCAHGDGELGVLRGRAASNPLLYLAGWVAKLRLGCGWVAPAWVDVASAWRCSELHPAATDTSVERACPAKRSDLEVISSAGAVIIITCTIFLAKALCQAPGSSARSIHLRQAIAGSSSIAPWPCCAMRHALCARAASHNRVAARGDTPAATPGT